VRAAALSSLVSPCVLRTNAGRAAAQLHLAMLAGDVERVVHAVFDEGEALAPPRGQVCGPWAPTGAKQRLKSPDLEAGAALAPPHLSRELPVGVLPLRLGGCALGGREPCAGTLRVLLFSPQPPLSAFVRNAVTHWGPVEGAAAWGQWRARGQAFNPPRPQTRSPRTSHCRQRTCGGCLRCKCSRPGATVATPSCICRHRGPR